MSFLLVYSGIFHCISIIFTPSLLVPDPFPFPHPPNFAFSLFERNSVRTAHRCLGVALTETLLVWSFQFTWPTYNKLSRDKYLCCVSVALQVGNHSNSSCCFDRKVFNYRKQKLWYKGNSRRGCVCGKCKSSQGVNLEALVSIQFWY